MRHWWALLAVGTLVLGCKGKDDPKGGDDDDDDVYGNIDCGADYDTPTPSSCLTDTIDCDSSFLATTVGGTTFFGLQQWKDAQCADWLGTESDTTILDGPERVYEFDVPDGKYGKVIVESPCEELELRAVKLGDTNCPSSPTNCRVATGDWDDQEVTALQGGNTYLIIVDGYDGGEGNFELRSTCY
ncbi:MAG: hypothetical protein HN348_34565 [Proteobacteria bacterium]|jgi:hypothetical protein|nr:hypothetical protein [Pseudomonadota bacterium]